MLRPFMPAWIEQRNELTRFSVERADIAALPSIAAEAGVREIIQCRPASMLPANDVV